MMPMMSNASAILPQVVASSSRGMAHVPLSPYAAAGVGANRSLKALIASSESRT
jgi:hypothetical protein